MTGNNTVGSLLIISYSSMGSIGNENCILFAPDNGVPDIYRNEVRRNEVVDEIRIISHLSDFI